MLLYYIRHGDPIYNPDQLTPLGRRQAEAIGKRLAIHGIDKIYSSTSTRAYQTAQPMAEMLKKEITQLEFCHENHAWADLTVTREDGRKTWAFTDLKTARLFISPEVRRLDENWYDHPAFAEYNFKQGIQRIQREADAFLESLGYKHIREKNIYQAIHPNEDRVALFAHEGFGLAFLSSVLDIPYPMFCTHFSMSHTGMSVIEFKEKDGFATARALMVASDGHLYREGLHTNYQNVIRV